MDSRIEAAFERAADGPVTVDITTVGRVSGEPRRIEIWIVKVDDRVVIGGTPGRRDWYANLLGDPTLVVHLKDDVIADVPAVAVSVNDVDVRVAIWTHHSTRWYRQQSSVEDLVGSAPTVALTFG